MKILFFDNYLSFIKNSKNSKQFKDFYIDLNGEYKNITENGKLSCAYFVTSVLKTFSLIESLHTTVSGTLKDIENSGWYELESIYKGSILVWEAKDGHKHIGFYVGNNKAISNSSKNGVIKEHHFSYMGKRKIDKVYYNNLLIL